MSMDYDCRVNNLDIRLSLKRHKMKYGHIYSCSYFLNDKKIVKLISHDDFSLLKNLVEKNEAKKIAEKLIDMI